VFQIDHLPFILKTDSLVAEREPVSMEHKYAEDKKVLSFQKALREFLQGVYNSDKVHLDDTSPFYSIPGGDIPLRYGHYTFRYRYSDGKYIFYP
jgi:hypothetical protein